MRDKPLDEQYPTVWMWAKDFHLAVYERPWWAKLLLRFALGKYAFHEFIGLRDYFFNSDEHMGIMNYELENMDYHQEKIPLIWWRNED